ncbi:MAG: sigma-54 dependent transcriptional regulator, partial [Bacillota bacterium]|nr:sigma-54 dependent transcriptional regulator [Bacillota bacterium]
MRKQKIYLHIQESTRNGEYDTKPEHFTAEGICNLFQVKRNTISHYLNELYEEGMLIKINTRPVYFLDKEALSQKHTRPITVKKFASLDEMKHFLTQNVEQERSEDVFEELIGAKGSLKKTIEQVKTAVLYPPKGLPVLITGPTGAGKSHLAG